MLSRGIRRAILLVCAAVAGIGVGAALPAAALPAAAAGPGPSTPCVTGAAPGSTLSPLKFCVTFDKASYQSSDPITITATVTNQGTTTADNVSLLSFQENDTLDVTHDFSGVGQGNQFTDPNRGVDIAPGATVTATATGFAVDPAAGFVEFTAEIVQPGMPGGALNSSLPVDISAPVTQVFGNYGGTVYTTTDLDDQPAPRAGLAGVQVTLSSQLGGPSFTATTDGTGHFLFSHLPGGPYSIRFAAPQGWLVETSSFTVSVNASGFETNPSYLAVRPVSDILQAAISFDQPSYRQGDTANLTVTLTNLSDRPISGVRSACDLSGEGDVLNDLGPGWSPLNSQDGVVLQPGATVFHVTSPVPDASIIGVVEIECAFGNNPDSFDGEPFASAQVPFDPGTAATAAPANIGAASATPTKTTTVHIAPAPAAPAGSTCETTGPVRLCANFDRTSYTSGNIVRPAITITNLGATDLDGLWLAKTGGTYEQNGQWNDATGTATDINTPGVGLDLAAGQSLTVSSSGYQNNASSDVVEMNETLEQSHADLGRIDISAPLHRITGGYTGTVYTDTDVNGAPASRAGLAGVEVDLFAAHGDGGAVAQADTDAQGHFTFTGLAGGQYTVDFVAPGGWSVQPGANGFLIDVDRTGFEVAPQFLATQPESHFLTASMSFDQPGYHIGDTANLTVTLTNNSGRALPGVRDHCDFQGGPGQLAGTGTGWDPLADGVVLQPGTTTFRVSEVVPSASGGVVTADCVFGNQIATGGEPRATTTATAD